MPLIPSFLLIVAALASSARAETPNVPAGLEEAKLQAVADSREWHVLMHYKRGFPFYNLDSELDGAGFFMSPEGRSNPLAELKATIAAFQDTKKPINKLGEPAICSFPARADFIRDKLGIDFPKTACPKLDEFIGRFKAKSATLVFSSAYPNNPGSMFGHTFLRINSRSEGADRKRQDLLDYGLSYAAMVSDDENPIIFMIFGLAGGYQGQLAMSPYYLKVNEYSDGESRDLWEYDLDLNPAQTDRLIKHAWELETTSHFNYFFFDENCAYLLLTLLEAARPDWNISKFPIYIIPAETIKRLTNLPGAVTRVRYRPSLRRKMIARFDALSSDERKTAYAVGNAERDPEGVDSARALEAATTYIYYRQKERGGPAPDEEKKLLQRILVRRSELPGQGIADEIEADPDPFLRPELGHYPFRLGLASGRAEKSDGRAIQNFTDLHFKFAYHDLLNSDIGYTPYSQIDFPGIKLRRDWTRDKTRIEEFHFLSLTSLFPLQEIEKKPSWHFSFSSVSPFDRPCFACKALHGEIGAGASLLPFSRRWIVYAFVTPAFDLWGPFDDARFVPNVELSTIYSPFDRTKVQLKAKRHYDLFQRDRQRSFATVEANASQSFSRRLELRAMSELVLPSSEDALRHWQAALHLNYYFP